MQDKSNRDLDREHRKRKVISLLSVPLFLAVAAWNLRGAGVIATREGKSLADVVGLWLAGFDPNATYSGITLLAIERLENALLIVGILLLWGVSVYSTRLALRRAEERWAETERAREPVEGLGLP